MGKFLYTKITTLLISLLLPINTNSVIVFVFFFLQVSSTHQRLTVELTDMAESEQQQTEQQNTDVEGSRHDMQVRAISTFHDHNSHIM